MYGALAVGGTVGVGAFWSSLVDKPVGTPLDVSSAGKAVGAASVVEGLLAVAAGVEAESASPVVLDGALSAALLVWGGRFWAATEVERRSRRAVEVIKDGPALHNRRMLATISLVQNRCEDGNGKKILLDEGPASELDGDALGSRPNVQRLTSNNGRSGPWFALPGDYYDHWQSGVFFKRL